jgi:hypothetical protein
MNQSGLYWPNGRSLFRRRLPGRVRFAASLVFVAALVVTAAATMFTQ